MDTDARYGNEVERVLKLLLPSPLAEYPAVWQAALPRMVREELEFQCIMGQRDIVTASADALAADFHRISADIVKAGR